ncbi:outer membrane beta-barrel protein [Marinobacter alkaliphilus]|uniref:Outer membrane beta-barrel protein n=1 Tax=Marinobacter alkaliphilus TaxID=254719 RepID=A0ABZ3E946_9GAMM
MKKLLIASVATAGLLGSVAAHADMYGQVKLGSADLTLSDNAVVGSVVVGKSVSGYENFALEAELMVTLKDAEETWSNPWAGDVKVEGSATTLGGYGVYNFTQLSDTLVPFVRLGLVYLDIEAKASNSTVSVSEDDSSIKVGFGAGIRYNLNDQFGIVGDYTSVDDADILNIGLQYNF